MISDQRTVDGYLTVSYPVETEIKDALKRLKVFSKHLASGGQTLFGEKIERFETDSDYLKFWFSHTALQEILFYRSIITIPFFFFYLS